VRVDTWRWTRPAFAAAAQAPFRSLVVLWCEMATCARRVSRRTLPLPSTG
jgi:hypothetical protein